MFLVILIVSEISTCLNSLQFGAELWLWGIDSRWKWLFGYQDQWSQRHASFEEEGEVNCLLGFHSHMHIASFEGLSLAYSMCQLKVPMALLCERYRQQHRCIILLLFFCRQGLIGDDNIMQSSFHWVQSIYLPICLSVIITFSIWGNPASMYSMLGAWVYPCKLFRGLLEYSLFVLLSLWLDISVCLSSFGLNTSCPQR